MEQPEKANKEIQIKMDSQWNKQPKVDEDEDEAKQLELKIKQRKYENSKWNEQLKMAEEYMNWNKKVQMFLGGLKQNKGT